MFIIVRVYLYIPGRAFIVGYCIDTLVNMNLNSNLFDHLMKISISFLNYVIGFVMIIYIRKILNLIEFMNITSPDNLQINLYFITKNSIIHKSMIFPLILFSKLIIAILYK